MTPRSVLLIGALSLTLGWLVGNSTSSPPSQGDRPARQSGPRPLGGAANAPPPPTRQLRERVDTPPPRRPSVGRNPFVFGTRRPTTYREAPAEASPASPVPMAAAIPEAPVEPVFKLSGIASSLQDGTTVWTAIINDHGSLAFVKEGDLLSNGCRVVRVEEASVVIIDAAGITQTLRLP